MLFRSKEAFQNAKEAGKHIYGFTVMIHPDCLLKAARAFLVFKAVEDFGEIILYRPSSQDIEDEKFELDFSFFLASADTLDKIIPTAKAVSEIDMIAADEVNAEDFLGKKEEPAPSVEEAALPAAMPAQLESAKKAQPAAVKKAGASKPVTSRTVRVDIEKLDALMNQVSELIIAKNSLVSISTTEGGNFENQTFHEQIEYLERITTNLHESVMKVRMVPIESVVNKFPRMIRDLSRKLNKSMELYKIGRAHV